MKVKEAIALQTARQLQRVLERRTTQEKSHCPWSSSGWRLKAEEDSGQHLAPSFCPPFSHAD